MPNIVLQLANTANTAMLIKHFHKTHQVLDCSGCSLPAGGFDLAILDAQHLVQGQDDILARKDAVAPAILPFILLIEPHKQKTFQWAMGGLVEETLPLPVNKQVLDARVANLLKLRFMAEQQENYRQRLENAWKREDRALRLVQRVNRAIVTAQTEQSLLDQVCTIATNIGKYEKIGIKYLSIQPEKESRMRLVAGNGLGTTSGAVETSPCGQAWQDDEYPGARVISERRHMLLTTEAGDDHSFGNWKRHMDLDGLQAAVILPLAYKGAAYGVVELYAARKEVFDGKEIDLLVQLAEDMSFGISVQRENAKRRRDRQKIHRLAYYDPLTGLPNRKYLMETLEATIDDPTQSSAAVLFIDLDNFKLVNDALGHTEGDKLLQKVSIRLQETMRSSDLLARLGGDEFVLLLIDPPRHGHENRSPSSQEWLADCAQKAARRCLHALEEPISIDDYEHHLDASIGISLYPFTARSAGQLLDQADIAMYASKNDQRKRFVIYSEPMASDREKRLSLEARLHQALKNDEFRLYYQPIFSFKTGRIQGLEALIRWLPAQGGLVSPGEFLPVAHETGLILPIGNWVLNQACTQLKAWQEAGLNVSVAVNVAARQISQSDFIVRIQEQLDLHHIPARKLHLELTEESMLSDPDLIGSHIEMLREIGVKVAVDDFGTGYSSLSRLQNLPISILKIDKSFIDTIDTEHAEAPVVRAIMNLAHSFKIQTIGEGIENRTQFEYLKKLGCTMGQGYYVSKPQPAEDITLLLQDEEWAN